MNRRSVGLRQVFGLGCLAAILVFAFAACGNGQDASTPGPKASGDASVIDTLSIRPNGGVACSTGPVSTVEEVLERGLRLAGASPVHLAFRGTANADSVRCEWRGIARTPAQREGVIRFWLGLDDDDPIPEANFLDVLFNATFDVIDPLYRETAKSNFMAIVEGGLSKEYLFLTCYADYAPSEYLLGAGALSPNKLSVAYGRMGEARSYELHLQDHEEGAFGAEPVPTREEYESLLRDIVLAASGL